MSFVINQNIRTEALNYIQFVASKRDAQPSKKHITPNVFLSKNQIWGRIFSYLPSISKQSVALTCRDFYGFLKEEDERYVQEIIRYISENYLIFDTNINLQYLKRAIKKGMVFLLGDTHNKPSQLRIHESFMRIMLTPETSIITESSSNCFTKDPTLLAHAQAWGMQRIPLKNIAWSSGPATEKPFPVAKLKAAPPCVSQQLIKVLQKSNFEHEDISIALTLMFLYLIDEKSFQRFTQTLLFFHNLVDCHPKEWPPDIIMQAYAKGELVPDNLAKAKLGFLSLFLKLCETININLNHHTLEMAKKIDYYEHKNDGLVGKISKIFEHKNKESAWGRCVIAQGGVAHFFDNCEVIAFLLSGKTAEPALCTAISSKLSEKKIPYIVLYPREVLIYQPKQTAQLGDEEYKKSMVCYIGLDVLLGNTSGKKQESVIDRLLHCYSMEELTQEFLAFLTNEKKDINDFSGWMNASFVVCRHALNTYKTSLNQRN